MQHTFQNHICGSASLFTQFPSSLPPAAAPRRGGKREGFSCLCVQTDGVRLPDKSLQALLLIKSLKNVTALSSMIFKGWQRTGSARG